MFAHLPRQRRLSCSERVLRARCPLDEVGLAERVIARPAVLSGGER